MTQTLPLATLLTLVALILLSGFFSMSETALFSISKVRARHLAKRGGAAERLILRLKDNPHTLLTTILIGNNLVNVGASALATSLAITLFDNHAVGIATGVMTFLILVFGEIFPKSLATRNNVLIARAVIRPLYWFSLLFWPAILLLNFIPRLTGLMRKRPGSSEQELLTYVEMVAEEGEIDRAEKELIEKIFRLDDTTVDGIMTRRTDVYVIDIQQPPDLGRLVESGYTRIPVSEGSPDNVIGVLNIKDLFAAGIPDCSPKSLRALLRPPFFVPESMTLDRLLVAFKGRRQHLAIVVDEYGGVSGIVTLEDVLEEIVGEITDETDVDERNVVGLRDQEWLVRGRTPIAEVNLSLGTAIPLSEDYDTFSGWVFERLQRVPKKGEQLELDDLLLQVKEAHGPRIREYQVRRRPPPTQPGEAAALADDKLP